MTRMFLHIAKGKDVILVTMLFLLPVLAFWLVGAATDAQLVAEITASYFLLWGLAALLSRTPQDELRKQFLLLTVTLLCTLVTLEAPAALGIIEYRSVFGPTGDQEWEEPGRIFDNELLWRSQPHYEQHIKYTRGNIGAELCLPPGPEREYDLRYDQNGFRNSEDFVTADVAVIGDSYVESPMMESSHIMTSVLAQLQKKVIVNLGMAGYGPQQELVVFKRYVPQLHPNTVVWVYYGGNDLSDANQYKGLKEMANSQGGLSKLWKRSLTKSVLSAFSHVSRKCMPRDIFVDNYMVLRDADGGKSRVYFLHGDPKLGDPELKALDIVRASFTEAYQLSRELGTQFVVAFAPRAYDTHYDLSNVLEVSERVKAWKPNDLSVRIRAMLADISPDIGYLDLTPALRSTAEKGHRVFMVDDTHWTALGHRVVSEAISDFLNTYPQEIHTASENESEH